jgi:hypothetical protein
MRSTPNGEQLNASPLRSDASQVYPHSLLPFNIVLKIPESTRRKINKYKSPGCNGKSKTAFIHRQPVGNSCVENSADSTHTHTNTHTQNQNTRTSKRVVPVYKV